ncbi:MAG: LicD family protein [Clostridia bacterium]|nr:LicD family protein [Clostridia bacterium]
MREISDIKEIRKILLEIASEIKQICEENKLRFFMSGGTLLGAVRHKGFIPWDDDIDFHMPRPDYEKFIQIYNSKPRTNILHCQETNPNYLYSYAKLAKGNTLLIEKGCHSGVEMGVYIDIFPIEGVGDTVEGALELMNKIDMPIKLLMSYRMDAYRKHVSLKKNLQVVAAKIMAKFYGFKKLSNTVNTLAQTYNYDESKYIASFIDEVGERRIYPKEAYDEVVYLDFEDMKLPAPAGYDMVLTKFYGDYMTLPPKEKQVLTHDYKAYVKED